MALAYVRGLPGSDQLSLLLREASKQLKQGKAVLLVDYNNQYCPSLAGGVLTPDEISKLVVLQPNTSEEGILFAWKSSYDVVLFYGLGVSKKTLRGEGDFWNEFRVWEHAALHLRTSDKVFWLAHSVRCAVSLTHKNALHCWANKSLNLDNGTVLELKTDVEWPEKDGAESPVWDVGTSAIAVLGAAWPRPKARPWARSINLGDQLCSLVK